MGDGPAGIAPAANQHKEVLFRPWEAHVASGVDGPLRPALGAPGSTGGLVQDARAGRPAAIRAPLRRHTGLIDPFRGRVAMKSARKKRASVVGESTTDTPALTTFSSDLLTPEEERELLSSFWDCKSELVRILLRQYPNLRANRPPFEPWPMAQFIREFCTEDSCHESPVIRRLHDKYVHFKHRLASANIRLAAHVAKRFRHHALSYSDLLQEAVCGLMQAIDRFDVSHGTRLATYATWWIRQTLQIAVARQSHLVSLSPHHLQELGLLQQESEALAHGGKHLPSPQEL